MKELLIAALVPSPLALAACGGDEQEGAFDVPGVSVQDGIDGWPGSILELSGV